jgi:hypothetical protein
MFRRQLRNICAVLAGTLILAALAGCAAGPGSGNAVEWVVSQEAEKKRLNDQGFPQYNPGT